MSDNNLEAENVAQPDSATVTGTKTFGSDVDLKRALRLASNDVTDDKIDGLLLHLDNQIGRYRQFAAITKGQYVEPTKEAVLKAAAEERDFLGIPFNFSLGYIVYPETEIEGQQVNLYRGIYGAPLTNTQQSLLVRKGILTEEFIEEVRTGQKNLSQILDMIEGKNKYLADRWRKMLSENGIQDLSRKVPEPEILKHFINLHKNDRLGFAISFWLAATTDSQVAVEYFSVRNPEMGRQDGPISGVFSLKVPEKQIIGIKGFWDASEIEQSEVLIWGAVKPEWLRIFVPKGIQSNETVLDTLKSINK